MSVGFSSDSTPAATFSRRHPPAMETAPLGPRADYLKSRIDERRIAPTGFRRFSRPVAFVQAQKHTRGKACDPWNQEARNVGAEISQVAEASRSWRPPRSADHGHARAQERARRQSTNRAAQPPLRLR